VGGNLIPERWTEHGSEANSADITSVPPRTRTTPSLGMPQIHEPHSGTNQSGVDAPAIGGALKLTRLKSHQAKPLLGDDDPQGERSAGQALAIQAVTGID